MTLINREETYSSDNQFECLSYGSVKERNYASVPDIDKEVVDSEKVRIVKKTAWKPVFIKIPIKGVLTEFAMRKTDDTSKPNLLYSALDLKAGIVTDPIGEYFIQKDGKTKIKFYKKGGYRQIKSKKRVVRSSLRSKKRN